jgi:RHS repeat-associated protein
MVLMAVTALPLHASLTRSDTLSSQVAKVTEADVSSLPVVKPDDGADEPSLLCASAPLREKIVHRHFVWGPDIAGQQTSSLESGAEGVGGLLLIREWKSGRGMKQYLPLTDGLGSVCGLIDATDGSLVAEYDYDPYGGPVIERGLAADACPFRHRTRYYDSESWLYYYGYRYYDPSTTKWISKDPLGETGGWNLTCFCDNDPVNKYDPTGLMGEGYLFDWLADAANSAGSKTQSPTLALMLDSFENSMRSDAARDPIFSTHQRLLHMKDVFNANGLSGGSSALASEAGDQLLELTPYPDYKRATDPNADTLEQIGGWCGVVGKTALLLAPVAKAGVEFRAGFAEGYAKPVAPATQPVVNLKQTMTDAGSVVKSLPDPYTGVKQASGYLKDMGVSRADRVRYLQSFEPENIVVRQAGESEFALRFFSDPKRAGGQYLFETFPASRQSLAIKPKWSNMSGFRQFQIRPEATIVEGRAAAQGPYLPGGQKQKFILDWNSDLIAP